MEEYIKLNYTQREIARKLGKSEGYIKGGISINIILISGKARAGKDSSAIFLKQKLEAKDNKVLIAHYANLLKYLAKTYFNWNGEKDECGRSLIQWLGTDVIRKQKPNYWVDFLIEFLSMFKDEWDYVLIPDCRFPNELTRWNENWNTTTVRVNRLNFESDLTPEQKNHISETALDTYNFDYYIESESGLDHLEKEVDKFLKWMEEMDE